MLELQISLIPNPLTGYQIPLPKQKEELKVRADRQPSIQLRM